VHEEARAPDDDDEDEDNSTLPEAVYNHGQDHILAKVTEDDQIQMLEQNRMLLNSNSNSKPNDRWREPE
jgi:hypothetical protein